MAIDKTASLFMAMAITKTKDLILILQTLARPYSCLAKFLNNWFTIAYNRV